jgi:DNA-binding transcriptional MerR regulator
VGGGDGWKIDELAQRAGISVDTIRFYQREGLVQPGTRRGKSMAYGPVHLERLQRITELRAGHFTLTAIRRMLDEGRFAMLERLFHGDGRPRSRAQLVDESGLPATLVDELEAIGFVAAPGDRGATEFDSADVRVLQAVRELTELGTPLPVVPIVTRIYVRHLRALQRELLTTLAGDTDLGPELGGDEVIRFRRQAAILTEEYLSRWDVIMDYLHHRTIQRLVHLAEAERAGELPAGELRAGEVRAGEVPARAPAGRRPSTPPTA